MKPWITVFTIIGAVITLVAADYSTTTAGRPPGGSSVVKTNEVSPSLAGEYQTLKRLELSSKLALLTELVQEHGKNSDMLRSAQPQRAEWEKQLVQDLQNRISVVSKELNALTGQGSDTEKGQKIPASGPGGGNRTTDEIIYLTILQERLARVQKELAAAMDAGYSFVAELQTNSTPENMTRVSYLVQDNAHVVRELEREESDLQLKKLEFFIRRK